MGKFYEIEVHYIDYDVIGVMAESESEAHEKAVAMYESANPHIIGIRETGTIAIDHEDIDNGTDEHTWTWYD